MVTAIIGRRFLDQYNQQRGIDLSAKEFFETVYFPLFYGHPKYMMDGGNTALTNPKIPKGTFPSTENRQKRFETLVANIEAGYLDTRTTLDFPASEEQGFRVTSGQVTDFKAVRNSDTAYCSWIGNGFGVGIGGITALFDNPSILNTIFEGWHHYRSDLNDPAYTDIPGNKINGWNAHWLAHSFGGTFHADDVRFGFPPPFEKVKDGEDVSVKRLHWLKIILAIARKLPDIRLTGYLYHYDKTNKTYGFIPFDLPQIRRPSDLYIKLFGDYAYQRDGAVIESLYGSSQPFQRICQMGAIGVSALEPKGLRELIPSGRGEVKNFKYDSTNTDNQVTFNTYITWLLAMLNNDEFWDEAGQAANLLLRYETVTKRQKDLSTLRGNQVDNVRNAAGKKQFMNALATVMENANVELLTDLEAFAKKVHKLPDDNFPYFLTLIRLRYAKQSRETDSPDRTPDLFSNN